MVQADRMEMGGTAFAFYGLGAGVAAAFLVALRRRLQLSRAKHASLSGHARIARRIAAFVAGVNSSRLLTSVPSISRANSLKCDIR